MGLQVNYALCIFILVCAVGKNEAGKRRYTRAINGEPALPGEFPYTVILTDEDGFLHCGGVLISDQAVLTTAVCLESYEDASELRVRMGTNRWVGGDGTVDAFVEATVDQITPHPNFDSSELKNDLAVVNLFTPVLQSAKVGVACLPSVINHVGQNATFSGWGYLEDGTRNEVLHKLELGVIELKQCEAALQDFSFDDTILCTYAPAKDICAGDQGGPLVTRNADGQATVIGVASWTTCTAGTPAVFTNVASYLDWIKATMVGGYSCFKD